MEFVISSDPVLMRSQDKEGVRPCVSVAIATYNAAAHIEAAVASALRQTLVDIEIVIVDDCSTDETHEIVEQLARADPRIVLDRLTQNGGPAAARNRALALAKGEWFAVLDSDDLYAPDRLERLVAVANRSGADIIADDLILFDDTDPGAATYFLGSRQPSKWIGLEEYLQQTMMYATASNLGYLKPLIRTDRLRDLGLRYDERLRIAEDDDFVLRMLAAGLRYWLEAAPGYAYRRHSGSTSHRLSSGNATAMVAASDRLKSAALESRPEIRVLLQARHHAFERAATFARLVEALKARRMVKAAIIAARSPGVLPMLRMPVSALLRRIARRPAASMTGHGDPSARAAMRHILDTPGIVG